MRIRSPSRRRGSVRDDGDVAVDHPARHAPSRRRLNSNTCAARRPAAAAHAHLHLQINSNTPGVFTATADVVWQFDDGDAGANPATATVNRATDGDARQLGRRDQAVRRRQITIGPPDGTNTVGDPHTFFVSVSQDDGLTAAPGGDGVTGFGPVPNGTQVDRHP